MGQKFKKVDKILNKPNPNVVNINDNGVKKINPNIVNINDNGVKKANPFKMVNPNLINRAAVNVNNGAVGREKIRDKVLSASQNMFKKNEQFDDDLNLALNSSEQDFRNFTVKYDKEIESSIENIINGPADIHPMSMLNWINNNYVALTILSQDTNRLPDSYSRYATIVGTQLKMANNWLNIFRDQKPEHIDRIFYPASGKPVPYGTISYIRSVENKPVLDDVLMAYRDLPDLLKKVNDPEYKPKAIKLHNQIRALEEKKLKEFEQEIEPEEIDLEEKENPILNDPKFVEIQQNVEKIKQNVEEEKEKVNKEHENALKNDKKYQDFFNVQDNKYNVSNEELYDLQKEIDADEEAKKKIEINKVPQKKDNNQPNINQNLNVNNVPQNINPNVNNININQPNINRNNINIQADNNKQNPNAKVIPEKKNINPNSNLNVDLNVKPNINDININQNNNEVNPNINNVNIPQNKDINLNKNINDININQNINNPYPDLNVEIPVNDKLVNNMAFNPNMDNIQQEVKNDIPENQNLVQNKQEENKEEEHSEVADYLYDYKVNQEIPAQEERNLNINPNDVIPNDVIKTKKQQIKDDVNSLLYGKNAEGFFANLNATLRFKPENNIDNDEDLAELSKNNPQERIKLEEKNFFDRYAQSINVNVESIRKGPAKYEPDEILKWVGENYDALSLLTTSNFSSYLTPEQKKLSEEPAVEMAGYWLNLLKHDDPDKMLDALLNDNGQFVSEDVIKADNILPNQEKTILTDIVLQTNNIIAQNKNLQQEVKNPQVPKQEIKNPQNKYVNVNDINWGRELNQQPILNNEVPVQQVSNQEIKNPQKANQFININEYKQRDRAAQEYVEAAKNINEDIKDIQYSNADNNPNQEIKNPNQAPKQEQKAPEQAPNVKGEKKYLVSPNNLKGLEVFMSGKTSFLKTLKEFEKDLLATDPKWLLTNTQQFKDLKASLAETIHALDEFKMNPVVSRRDDVFTKMERLEQVSNKYAIEREGTEDPRQQKRTEIASKIHERAAYYTGLQNNFATSIKSLDDLKDKAAVLSFCIEEVSIGEMRKTGSKFTSTFVDAINYANQFPDEVQDKQWIAQQTAAFLKSMPTAERSKWLNNPKIAPLKTQIKDLIKDTNVKVDIQDVKENNGKVNDVKVKDENAVKNEVKENKKDEKDLNNGGITPGF